MTDVDKTLGTFAAGDDTDSRFATWGPIRALALLLAIGAFIVWGLIGGLHLVDRTEGVPTDRTDAALYAAVAERVSDGENYYGAAATEHRDRGYPLRPFVTVREPALAYVEAVLGGPGRMLGALIVVAIAAAGAFVLRLERTASGKHAWWASAALVAATVVPLVGPMQAMMHEVWAAMLILLSLALRGDKRFWASVGFGLAAVLVRELALPYLLIMTLFAWHDGKRREAMAWLAAIAVFAIAFAAHAALVLDQVAGSDSVSEGWLRFGGWPFVLDLLRRSSFLAVLPGWVAAGAVPLALLGWLSRSTPLADRAFVTIGAFVGAFMIIGRTENSYWGILFVMLLLPGLAFAPTATKQLARAARTKAACRDHPVADL